MITDFLLPFFTIALSELGDKTQLTILVLSSKTKEHGKLLLGISLAFLITTIVAVFLGSWISSVIPFAWIKLIAGVLFIIFGVKTWLDHAKSDTVPTLSNPFFSGLSLILIAEMGDKSQLVSGLFSTKFNPIFVFLGAWLALLILSALAIFAGKILSQKMNYVLLHKIAGLVFVLLGLSFLFF
ncbi:MAG: TMEM165/GDT1 family protein [Candidatus Diapherotrites archaeon]|nr:TMEM165/GDT1 family protein [Candidatus Diapherotrites archaeon]